MCKLNKCSCTHWVAPVYCNGSQGCWKSTKISYSTYYLLSSRKVFSFVTSASFRLCDKDWDFPAAAFENLPIYTSWEKDRLSGFIIPYGFVELFHRKKAVANKTSV